MGITLNNVLFREASALGLVCKALVLECIRHCRFWTGSGETRARWMRGGGGAGMRVRACACVN